MGSIWTHGKNPIVYYNVLAHGPINVISVDFKDSHFEFRVNQESYGFFSVIIGFFIQNNMGLETKIWSLSILDAK